VAGGVDNVNVIFLVAVGPVDGCSGRGDRNPPFLLLFHPVHRGSPVVDFTDLMTYPGIIENTLGRRRFARVDVGSDTDVPRE